jgi:sporulation protein YlmC with PRC-barrel domain
MKGHQMTLSSDPSQGAQSQQGARIVQRYPDDDNGPGPEIMAAGTLQGDDVINLKGEKIGDNEAIMLDVQSGRIAYAVLSFGGILGLGDKLFAVPWSSLTLDADRKCFILDVPKDKLQSAPGFNKDHWPSMADESWASQVHSYYTQQPYWRQ